MALITRISRLFQADFHAVLDRIEEPDIQLKQAIREMQFDLQQDEQCLLLMQHETETLEQATSQGRQQLPAFDAELDLCFSAGKHELARDLIRRKLETQRQLHHTTLQLARLSSAMGKLEKRIAEHREQLQHMEQKLDLLDTHSSEIPGQACYTEARHPVRKEEIEIAFLQEQQKRAAS